MKRRARQGRTPSSLAPPRLHPLARAAIVLLAVLQVVAPMWHVCALSGSSGQHSQHERQKPQKPAPAWKPKCGGGLKCPCVPPKAEPAPAASATKQQLSATEKDHSHGTCLALLLMGMPGRVSASFQLAFILTPRTVFARLPFLPPAVALMPQPPSRGPPRLPLFLANSPQA